MATEGESIVAEQSEVLSETEVNTIVEGTPSEPSAPVLPSDEAKFEVPEKFAGKSIEDVIKSYQELEKLKGGEAAVSEEEPNSASEPEEGGDSKEPTVVEKEQYDKYAANYDKNGGLSDAEYAELAKSGYDKATVDKEIAARSDRAEFDQYKQEKTLNDVLEPLGGGADKFKEVSDWANQSKPEADIIAFNEALAAAPKMAQQAMLKGLYAEYEAAGDKQDTILHTNTPQGQSSKGYKTQEEFFKDVGSEEYKTNPAYRQAVEQKMSQSRDDLFA